MISKLIRVLMTVFVLASCGCTDPEPVEGGEGPAEVEEQAAEKPPAEKETAPSESGEGLGIKRWVVTGRITDENGRAMKGVEVTASCGNGTLRPTGETTTDEAGDYTLRFGPGMLSGDGRVGMQAATIFAEKKGYYDRNLCRGGDLYMTDEPVGQSGETKYYTGKTIGPDTPRRLDFVLLPVATLQGVLVDDGGTPISGVKVWLTGKELPPSSSVLEGTSTDGEGRFRFEEVPTGFAWRFELRSSNQPEDRAFTLDSAGEYSIKIERANRATEGGIRRIGVIEGPVLMHGGGKGK